MRRFVPILIVVIGLLALAIDFWPGLKLPTLGDPNAGPKVLETKLGPRPPGRPARRVPGPPDQRPIAGRRGDVDDPRHHRAPGELHGRLGAGRRRPWQRPRRDRAPGGDEPRRDRAARRGDRPARRSSRCHPTRTAPARPAAPRASSTASHCPATRTSCRCSPATSSTSANPSTDQSGNPAVAFALKDDGAKQFADYTTTNVGNFFAIVLDGTVISAPVIQWAITGGTGSSPRAPGPMPRPR